MVKTGLDVLLSSQAELKKLHRVGLVSHPPAVLPDFTHILDALLEAGVSLTALFGPEHGFDASAADGASVDNSIDRRTGLPVFSLYGPNKEPGFSMLENVDTLLFDMQDVGVRFYTFISTLYYVLRGAAAANKTVIVLDRPNPINGCVVSGPSIKPGYESFVGIVPLPIRHGLTIGELAQYFNAEYGFRAELTVIQMEGWRRSMWFDDTGLPWTPLSPGMPHLSTAVVYPGMCFLEGTNLSEGRGTALPFEVAGAPWLDGSSLAQALNALALPGVRFRPVSFVPSSSKHKDETCQGIQVHVTDRSSFEPLTTGLHLIAECQAQAPQKFAFLDSSWEGGKPHFDLLAGSDDIRLGLEAGKPVEDIVQEWTAFVESFNMVRQKYLLYS
ncbi:MAG: DUF1343 domain-containing protein [Chloroflexi bacterium]|nr:MAG: DUF1343 domain-containing protein [Chloroflexota bacterium]